MAQYSDPLVLTSPHMKGQRVKDAQWLMAGHSRFKGLATYKDGQIDGDYGTLSAQATRRAKFWLGYPDRGINGVFGQTLYEYLRPEHWRPLPIAYRLRRNARLRAAVKKTPGELAIAKAITQLGYDESPAYSNRTKYGVWYGFNGVPWCAIFESWCFGNSGYKNYRYAAVERIYYDALFGRNNLHIVRSPKHGDIVLYSLHGSRFAHTAFFDKWVNEGSRFMDVGGNTSARDFSNGGTVARQERTTNLVLAYVRVGLK